MFVFATGKMRQLVAGGAELGGPRGPVPPHLFWIYVVKILKFRKIYYFHFFVISSCPPIKNLLPHTLPIQSMISAICLPNQCVYLRSSLVRSGLIRSKDQVLEEQFFNYKTRNI